MSRAGGASDKWLKLIAALSSYAELEVFLSDMARKEIGRESQPPVDKETQRFRDLLAQMDPADYAALLAKMREIVGTPA
jgi:hypothetical protein